MNIINQIVLEQNQAKELVFEEATNASEGILLDFNGKDEKLVILAKNTASTKAEFTIKMGNGLQGVVDYNSPEIGAGETAVINVESGRFKHMNGEKKGKVHIVPSDEKLKFCIVTLP